MLTAVTMVADRAERWRGSTSSATRSPRHRGYVGQPERPSGPAQRRGRLHQHVCHRWRDERHVASSWEAIWRR